MSRYKKFFLWMLASVILWAVAVILGKLPIPPEPYHSTVIFVLAGSSLICAMLAIALDARENLKDLNRRKTDSRRR